VLYSRLKSVGSVQSLTSEVMIGIFSSIYDCCVIFNMTLPLQAYVVGGGPQIWHWLIHLHNWFLWPWSQISKPWH